ncbi:hypothetical protein GCM10010232_46740 [Streptomyces amakusaensis]|uniref:Helix-turn-helix domain-containing protein n=1 Tax=Streptomyces amakusaensis TaxID=67271 RepID=A0ABW0AHZ5_9ACTN
MLEIDKVVGGRVEKARRRRGWHQRDLGAAIGRSESWVSQVERGVAALDSLAMAERISRVLGLTVDHVLAFDVRCPVRPPTPPSPVPSVAAPSDAAGSEAVLRRAFALGSLAGLATAVTGLSSDAQAQISRPPGSGVSPATADELLSIGASYRRSYRSFPASSLVPVAHHQVQ